jgi:hypothetical protein
MAYYSRYVSGMKKVVYGVSLLQLVLTKPSWAYHDVKSQWTQVLSCSSLTCSLWLKMTGVPLTPTKCTPRVLVIIDPYPCGFASDFECLSFIYFAESWMSKLTPQWSLLLSTSLTQFGWSLNDSPNLHRSCVVSTWSPKDGRVWSRVTICCSLMGTTTWFPRNWLDS